MARAGTECSGTGRSGTEQGIEALSVPEQGQAARGRRACGPSRRHLLGLAGLGLGSLAGGLLLPAFAVSAAHAAQDSSPASKAPGANAKRIISVGSDVTEIVYALGYGDRVVAVDTTSSWPTEVEPLPKVGYLRSLAAEGLLSMRPDLLLVGSGAGPETALRQIESTGVPVVRVPEGYSLDVVRHKITGVIEALGAEGKPASLALQSGFDHDRAALDDALPALRHRFEPKTTLLLAMGGTASPQAAGHQTAGEAIIQLVGGRNVFDHAGYKAVSLEALAAAAPDVILVLSHGPSADPMADITGNPLVKLTPAGRDGRVYSVSSTGLLAFGPRTPAYALELARKIRQSPRG